MTRAAGKPGRDAAPWWAEGGSERCPFCLQSYVYELEVRCEECDGPMCPVCTATERLTVVRHLCPECVGPAEAEKGGG